MIYSYEFFIPFHLSDPAGVLFFGNTFSLAHQAYERFISEHLKLSWDTWFKNSDWIVPIKHAESDYLRPLMAGKSCIIKLQVSKIGTTSFTLTHQFYQDEHECCVTKTTHVFCNKSTKRPQEIPEIVRVKLG
ncbi:MAG: acyl-CoA thioesterase [Parachlamydiaceae bacterium]|nr:acyl-CoA thioesterase [Parachlamydiaceae bacterium]